MLLIDVSFTSHCAAPTGVQRVTREVCRGLSDQGKALPVCFDRWQDSWRKLNKREQTFISAPPVTRYTKHRYRLSMGEVAAGMCTRLYSPLAGNTRLSDQRFDGLLVPEKLENRNEREIHLLRTQLSGPSVVVFHDLIPVKFPEYATRASSTNFPRYLKSLLCYDGVAAVSESSRQDLLDYWRKNRVRNPPPVETITPGTGLTPGDWEEKGDNHVARCQVLMVGTIEPRKNHRAVLEACERLWGQGIDFELTLVGRFSNDAGYSVRDCIRTLKAKNRPIRWVGYVGDKELKRLYQNCRFTLHPSLYEGFGLPVVESLSNGKPCIITDRGALAQIAKDGGCYVVGDPTSRALADAILNLLQNSALYKRLLRECREREFKRWDRYGEELISWQRSLKTRVIDWAVPVERPASRLGPRLP